MNIITNGIIGVVVERRAAVPKQCEFLLPIVDDLQDNLFENECGDAVSFSLYLIYLILTSVKAHGALRLTFHDAIGIDPQAGYVHSPLVKRPNAQVTSGTEEEAQTAPSLRSTPLS